MIQRLPFSYEGIDGDISRLGALLSKILAIAEVKLPSRLAILNLACGRADETGVLAKALAPSDIALYLGIDLRADAIAEATARWELPGGEICFREGNAAMIGRMQVLPEFDLVMIRHQNYWHDPLVWEGVLEEAVSAIRNGGYLLCTSYFDLEHELMLASMRSKDMRLLANLRHAASRPLPDAEGKSVDRWAALFGKK